jgi:hypothetical protein
VAASPVLPGAGEDGGKTASGWAAGAAGGAAGAGWPESKEAGAAGTEGLLPPATGSAAGARASAGAASATTAAGPRPFAPSRGMTASGPAEGAADF